jgi:hypothetical protein
VTMQYQQRFFGGPDGVWSEAESAGEPPDRLSVLTDDHGQAYVAYERTVMIDCPDGRVIALYRAAAEVPNR